MDLLERLKRFLQEEGVRPSFVAEKLNTNRATISHFTSGRRNLKESLAIKLDKYLQERNY